MRGRGYGRGVTPEDGNNVIPTEEKREDSGGAVGVKQGSPEKRSWLNIAAAAATLTLGIIRVIRDANDFYRKVKEGSR